MPEFDATIQYRPIAGFPAYRVGSDGSVWTCFSRTTKGNGKGRGSITIIGSTWRQLKTLPSPSGHLRVRLYPGKQLRHQVHRLVLEAFVGPCPQGMEARHFPDRNPENNNLSNPSWSTRQVNQSDRVVHGTHLQGSRNHNAVLTDEDVRAIRIKYASGGVSAATLGTTYGVSEHTILTVVHRTGWAHVV